MKTHTGRGPEGEDLEERIIGALTERPISVSKLAMELKLRRDFLAGFLEALRMAGKVDVINVGKAKVYMPRRDVK